MNRYFISILFLFLFLNINALECDTANTVQLSIIINTDQFAKETSWSLKNLTKDSLIASLAYEELENEKTYQYNFCLNKKECFEFQIKDRFGDGIKSPGQYQIFIKDSLITQESNFGFSKKIELNCGISSTCSLAPIVETGIHHTSIQKPWFAFRVDSLGSYSFSTCELNSCDTKLWIYEECEGLYLAVDQRGAIYYDDNEGACGLQAQITNTLLDTAKIYYLRLGTNDNSCSDSIHFEIKFNGPITGCTQDTSCNYNPFATIDDGSCFDFGNPNCPGAPDLTVSQVVFENSIFLDSFSNADPCMVAEGCLRGYGKRNIIRFSTNIANVGAQDYYIGKLTDNQGQFSDNNCHQHLHYVNYAEYLLFDEFGKTIPVGFKNGFCITDLTCDEGVEKKYSCANMGITAGCQDTYLSNLDCQWIDITDLPEGQYIMAIRINWNRAADLLDRRETDYENNWAQVCFELHYNNGNPEIQINENCRDYIDCAGQLYGNTIRDCKGICNGPNLAGDIDHNGQQDQEDLMAYSLAVVQNDWQAEPCYDLNEDGAISVFDAALLENCLNNGASHEHGSDISHKHCTFPSGIDKLQDTAFVFLETINYDELFFDLSIALPNNNLTAFQVNLSGMKIKEVIPLTAQYFDLQYDIAQSNIAGFFTDGNKLLKNNNTQAIVRVFYELIGADSICLNQKLEIINSETERISTIAPIPCMPSRESVATRSPIPNFPIKVFPNPSNTSTLFSFENKFNNVFTLTLKDVSGRLILNQQTYKNKYLLATDLLPKGIYFYQLKSNSKLGFGKLIVQ